VIQNWPHVLSAPLGAPAGFSVGHRDMAAGWTSGELPGQVTDQLAAWPPGPADGS